MVSIQNNKEACAQNFSNYFGIPEKIIAQKMNFLLRILSVNVIKSTVSCGFDHLLKKSLMVKFTFCAVKCCDHSKFL